MDAGKLAVCSFRWIFLSTSRFNSELGYYYSEGRGKFYLKICSLYREDIYVFKSLDGLREFYLRDIRVAINNACVSGLIMPKEAESLLKIYDFA